MVLKLFLNIIFVYILALFTPYNAKGDRVFMEFKLVSGEMKNIL